jgi:carbon monoxide dehydrogenase subunit G
MVYEVVVPIPVRLVWGVFHDPARLAACVPGWSDDEPPRKGGDGPMLSGRLRLRAGGTTITYRGAASVTEAEDLPLALAVTAEGVEARGDAPVKAVLSVRLDDAGTDTKLVFDGSMTAEGRTADLPPAQLAAALRRLADRFAAALTAELAPVRDQEAPDTSPARPSAARAVVQPRPVVVAAEPEAERPGMRRFARPAIAVLAVLLLVRLLRRRAAAAAAAK